MRDCRMKFRERRMPLLSVKENIEMELFSSEEPCVVMTTMEKEDDCSFNQRHLEHPLVPDSEEEEEEGEEPELLFETPPRKQQPKTRPEPPAKNLTKHVSPISGFLEETTIEMEVLPPLRVPVRELVELKPVDHSMFTPQTPSKANRFKWKSQTPQRTGLMVRDVVCIPRGLYLEQLERPVVPRGKERAALVATGMTARITIDSSWSANQMKSRLSLLFWGRFVKQEGQKFSFTYLQCVPGSRVLFIPDAPEEGWTGEQVLRTTGHGVLYILSHQDYPQTDSKRPETKTPYHKKQVCQEESAERLTDNGNLEGIQTLSHVCSPSEEKIKPDLDTILGVLRQKLGDHNVETQIQVRRGDVLHSALKVVRRPGFSFRTAPIVSFSGEETDCQEEALREFFRLTLLELQQTSIFEGLPGRLFFTCDLSALENRKYYEAGVLVGWSLVQGGPGPRCLHPVLYQLMCDQNPSLEDFSWRDIVEAEAQIRLQQLQSCTDVKLLPPSQCDWLSSCGIPEISSAHSDKIPDIYCRVIKHFTYHRVSSMISQFTEGLNSCGGLWDVIQSQWVLFASEMMGAQQHPLILEEFKQLFTVCYSPPGSLQRAAEEAAAAHWETALSLISNGKADFTFEDLFSFITGADHPPPLGFSRLIPLRFHFQDGSLSDAYLPRASSSAPELYLPTGVTRPADVLRLLSRAVHEKTLDLGCVQKEGDEEDSCVDVI
ncbi:uncharacterized protein LOC121511905 isoform X2 [Cheilinus undulatus]|uniref:uncharacterized protein LOC121511905 isoform X2 n=1 Tax=Cheilinus undulatus TaxID=241271 RepID=UPI001BD35DE8|nr:uncharacterized protein LOC121511905 isoform X2 [Cheilinus undulatus]